MKGKRMRDRLAALEAQLRRDASDGSPNAQSMTPPSPTISEENNVRLEGQSGGDGSTECRDAHQSPDELMLASQTQIIFNHAMAESEMDTSNFLGPCDAIDVGLLDNHLASWIISHLTHSISI
jgi:hypothetical protein